MNLGVDEDGMGELLEGVPEEVTKEEVLELEQERIAEGGKRKGNCRKRKERPPRKLKHLAEALADLNKLFRKLGNMGPNPERFS